ncbi:uncharacterized protein TNCV_4178451 [Trichonephila clavipes]|nr:uncharacterized protein TNCV_4178451 [Trichonephila clavipes]
MTPRNVFQNLCGIIFTGVSRNVFASKKDFVCVEELYSTSRSPDCNLLTNFGSPPIPFRALFIENGDFSNMALLSKEISQNLTRLAVSSIVRLGNTRPLPWHSRLGSICAKKLHSGVPPPTTESNKGGSVPVIWQNQARRLPEVHPEYKATSSGRGSNGGGVKWLPVPIGLTQEHDILELKPSPCLDNGNEADDWMGLDEWNTWFKSQVRNSKRSQDIVNLNKFKKFQTVKNYERNSPMST